jgi:hypothetical protein
LLSEFFSMIFSIISFIFFNIFIFIYFLLSWLFYSYFTYSYFILCLFSFFKFYFVIAVFSESKQISVLGTGNVGIAIAKALSKSNYSVFLGTRDIHNSVKWKTKLFQKTKQIKFVQISFITIKIGTYFVFIDW